MTFPITIFIAVSLLELYLFGMQRASLKISRHNNASWKGFGELMLPKWFPWTRLVQLGKYAILIWIAFQFGWRISLALMAIGYFIKIVIPIPYRTLYSKTFRKKVDWVKDVDSTIGEQLKSMLDATGF